MALFSHQRLASKAAGDDVTLSRFVRASGEPKRRRYHQNRFLGIGAAPAYVEQGRTKFPKTIKRVADVPRLLTSGHNNAKIGRDVRKGRFRGYWIYTLSFEERASCPSYCTHWRTCYGNNMPYAKRMDHRDPELLPAIERELRALTSMRSRPGVLVRLHALGDFYSPAYVAFWARMLATFPNLAIYGYTARRPSSRTGGAVSRLVDLFAGRAMIRFSDGRMATRSTVSIVEPEDCPPNAFVCPEQTGKTRACATCGACWSTLKNVAFVAH